MDKIQTQQKALLDAIELHDKSSMVSDLVTHMVNSITKISRQRRYCDFLVGEINSLAPAVPEWIADQTLSRPTIPRSLLGLSICNNERGE